MYRHFAYDPKALRDHLVSNFGKNKPDKQQEKEINNEKNVVNVSYTLNPDGSITDLVVS